MGGLFIVENGLFSPFPTSPPVLIVAFQHVSTNSSGVNMHSQSDGFSLETEAQVLEGV
jgi:hypothetical protein